MNIPKQYTHEYVICIPEPLQTEIMHRVKSHIGTLLLSDTEKLDAVDNARCSKLCDLTDTINIKFV